MMTAFQSITEKLAPLGIYKLHNDDLVTYEIMAYSNELQKIYDELQKIENEMFIMTANDFGLSQREKLLDITLNQNNITKRRNSLLLREKIISNPQTKNNIINILSAYDIECLIDEDIKNNTVHIKITNTSSLNNTQEYYTNKIKNTLPVNTKFIIQW